MALKVSYVNSLADIVSPVGDYLNSSLEDRDLFASDFIIVPNAGVRAWLMQQIATTVGTSSNLADGTPEADGIAANINIGYVGMIRQLAGNTRIQNDPWEIEPLTVAVLDCLQGFTLAPELSKRYGGMLRAARAIADKFDVYHARRPQMIDAWEEGLAVLAPELGMKCADGEWEVLQPALDVQDKWQYDLWRLVRQHIALPSPPTHIKELIAGLKKGSVTPSADRLLIAGLQALDVRNIELAQAIAAYIPVEVLLVHPSPALATKWAPEALAMLGSGGTLSIRPKDAVIEEGVHPLLSAWLQSTHEAQVLMGGFGLAPQFIAQNKKALSSSRLSQLQHSVLSQPNMPATEVSPNDWSLQIHRAHDLARQVEILHDALLHAFTQLKNLEPHEIVILCADMATSAPILESIFGRLVEVTDEQGKKRNISIPLVVADRGLREVSEGAQLLSALLQAINSRASRTSVMSVFSIGAVLQNINLNREVLETWDQLLDRTGLQWGLSDSHRAHRGFLAKTDNAYSWLSSVQQSLLGVLLPDAKPQAELGGVVPLNDLDTADVYAVSALSYLVSLLIDFETDASVQRSIIDWCSLSENMLVALCGDNSDALAEPIEVLRSLRKSSQMIGDGSSTVVPFEEFSSIVIERVEATPGRQPLRTGAVTATSFVPLRSVPFRVVCVLGYDDASVGISDLEGDDLSGRQRFVGTSDSRIDSRRTFLDAMLAAQDRFIVTCIGKSIKNNADVPFITPLAEFVDMCLDTDVSRAEAKDKLKTFVFDHPRHAMSAKNFIEGKVVPGVVWGHNGASFTAGSVLGGVAVNPLQQVVPFEVELASQYSIEDLIKVMAYPEDFFLATIGVSKWVDKVEADEAVLPLEIAERKLRELWNEFRDLSQNTPSLASVDPKKYGIGEESVWKEALRARGAISAGVLGNEDIALVKKLYEDFKSEAKDWKFETIEEREHEYRIELTSGLLTGEFSYFETNEYIGIAELRKPEQLRERAAMILLVLAAMGIEKQCALVFGYDSKNKEVSVNKVSFETKLSQADALRRLDGLLKVIHRAKEIPMCEFGTTARTIADTHVGYKRPRVSGKDPETLFDEFVASDSYGKSLERKIFGEEPLFTNIFPLNGPVVDCWTLRADSFFGPNFKSSTKDKISGVRVSGYIIK